MPRVCKARRICSLPNCKRFIPNDKDEKQDSIIVLHLDEFETIRSIDLEKLTQEECAKKMNVARTTIQAIYESARNKIARCLVESKELVIEGGEYFICANRSTCNKMCIKECPKQKSNNI